ncbi:MAG: polysaccharide biosynthesis tyrosine autokinase [Gemmatimonadaceae bacterium]
MSANIVPSSPGPVAPRHEALPSLQSWGAAPPQASFNVGEQIQRSVSAIKRYRWLILAIVAVGAAVGFAVTQFVKPKYGVNATIWIAQNGGKNGPIVAPGLISSDLAWPELAKSYLVLDDVVSKLALYVTPKDPADTLVFRNLLPSDSLRAAGYRLKVDGAGKSYQLIRLADDRKAQERVVERGAVGDSIGRAVGFLWQPAADVLRRGRAYEFDVETPREASLDLAKTLQVNLMPQSNLMTLQLNGDAPGLLATTLNTLVHVFVDQAGRLKKENLTAASNTVEEQLKQAKQQLESAEIAYESFKINTITLPTENTPLAPGISITMNPVLNAFFQDKANYDGVRRDVEAAVAMKEDAKSDSGRYKVEDIRSVPALLQSNTNLALAVTDLLTKQQQLKVLQQTYTDEFRLVKELKDKIHVLESETIPQQMEVSIAQVQAQEQEMKRRIDGAGVELKQIPARQIEEGRRKRDVDIANTIVGDLQTRAVAARLADLTTQPDVAILDSAVAPRRPSTDTAVSIFLVALAASVGIGLGLALLLDRMDKRFRYPEQATNELGLDVVGAVPTLLKAVKNPTARLHNQTQMVESFRSLSLTIRAAYEGIGPVQLTISSPGPGDGKSFVSANLATALSDGGYRTVLIDGDIRRGSLHTIQGMECDQSPGLLDYLAGEASLSEIVRPTTNPNLFLVPGGARRQHGPEMLASDAMQQLIRDLRNQFDAILVDTAPLGAGIDAYALGAATGAMVLVLRTGETDRRLAQAKLNVMDRMPVRLLGAILNDMGANPQFRYYSYLEGYEAAMPETGPGLITAGSNGKENGKSKSKR